MVLLNEVLYLVDGVGIDQVCFVDYKDSGAGQLLLDRGKTSKASRKWAASIMQICSANVNLP